MLPPPPGLSPPVLCPAVSPRAPTVDLVLFLPALLVVPSPAVVLAVTTVTTATMVVRVASPLEALSPLVASVALVRVVRAVPPLLLFPLVLSLFLRLAAHLKVLSRSSVFTPARSAPSRSKCRVVSFFYGVSVASCEIGQGCVTMAAGSATERKCYVS